MGGKIAFVGALLGTLALVLPSLVRAAPAVQQISTDPYTNAASQHQTEVEPDTFAHGNTIVSAFQVGRFFSGGGASNIGFATSTDGGQTWTSGFLPSLTVHSTPTGKFERATDPSVAYDAKHAMWLISILALDDPCTDGDCVTSLVVSRSSNGLSWSGPVDVAPPIGSSFAHDKNWIVCDNFATSPHYGNCYTSWGDWTSGARIVTSTSSNGGAAWGPAVPADDNVTGVGAQPVVQPNGTVVIPFLFWPDEGPLEMRSIRSTTGGLTFEAAQTIAGVSFHPSTAMRASPLPSAEVDQTGKVYVAWHDCGFRVGCSANDIVYSTSTDGVTWTSPARVPIDDVTSGVDHFIPGLAIDPQTQGSSTRLALAYYFFPNASCTFESCALNVGFISSVGGASWSAPQQLNATPMSISWIPNTTQGRMVGDYISTSFVDGGTAVPVFALASAPTGSTFHLAMFAAAIPVTAPPGPSLPPVSPTPPPTVPTTPPVGPPPQEREPETEPRSLALSRAAMRPRLPRAGRSFTVSVRARNAETGEAIRPGEVACPARVGGRPLRVARKKLADGVTSCTWRIPRSARGRRLAGSIRVGHDGVVASRRFSLTVR